MTRDEYLQALRDNLTTMTDDEKDDVIRYYLEYFIDSGNEQATMEELGAPEALADRLCGTDNYKDKKNEGEWRADTAGSYVSEGTYGKKKKSVGKIIALICTSPIWIPLAIAAVSVIAALGIVILSVALTVFIVAAVCVVGGAACLIAGAIAFAKSAADGLVVFGGGLVTIGIGILAYFLGMYIFRGIKALLKKLGRKD